MLILLYFPHMDFAFDAMTTGLEVKVEVYVQYHSLQKLCSVIWKCRADQRGF